MPSDRASDFEDFALALAEVAAGVTLPAFRAGSPCLDKAAAGRAFDPVTAADRDAEAALRREIARAWPAHGVIGEEYGEDRPDAEWVWVLDPIDGTRAFISGLPLWTTLVALLHEGEPVLGLVAQPYLRECFVGTEAGSRLVRPGEPDRPLRARACGGLGEATLSTTDPGLFAADEARAWERVRAAARLTRLGCDAYAYAMVAAGSIDVVVESALQLWDWAPHAPLIRGAGGQVTGWDGGPVRDGRIVAAGDPATLAETLDRLAWSSPAPG